MAIGIIQDGKFIHDLHKDEEHTFEDLLETEEADVEFLTGSSSEKETWSILKNSDGWVNNSSDTNNPPDYINKAQSVMLDFMTINDYERTTDGGKAINEPAKTGARFAQDVLKSGFMEQHPDISNIVIEYDDEMEPDYNQYYRNLCRVIDSHKKQIPRYRKNHPDCNKLIFAICDISEHEHFFVAQGSKDEDKVPGHPCYDIKFLRKIKQCGADTVIWFSPYISPPHGSTVRFMIIDIEALFPEKHGVHIQEVKLS